MSTGKPIVDKQKLLSLQLNDGRIVVSGNCGCIKGNFMRSSCNLDLAGLSGVDWESAYADLFGRLDIPNQQIIDGNTPNYQMTVFRLNNPLLVEVLDKWEIRLLRGEPGESVLKGCIAELEEHDLVEWKTEVACEAESKQAEVAVH